MPRHKNGRGNAHRPSYQVLEKRIDTKQTFGRESGFSTSS
jgi:hypothetical protein